MKLIDPKRVMHMVNHMPLTFDVVSRKTIYLLMQGKDVEVEAVPVKEIYEARNFYWKCGDQKAIDVLDDLLKR